jgi:PAS domain S-box-containing protein
LAAVLLVALTWARSLRKQVLQRTEQLHVEIAEHKRTEEALETSERFMRSLVESLPQNIVRKDLDGRFTFVNEFFCRTIGKSVDQIIGKTDFDFFPPELAAKYQMDDRRVLTGSRDFTAKLWDRITRKESTRFAGHNGGVDSRN